MSWTPAYQLLSPPGPGAARPARAPARSRRCRRRGVARARQTGRTRAVGHRAWHARRTDPESWAPRRSTTDAKTSRASCCAGLTSFSTASARTAIPVRSRRSSASACSAPAATRRARRRGAASHHVDVDGAPIAVELVDRRQGCLVRLDQCDESAASRLVPGRSGAALSGCWKTRAIRPRVAERISFGEVEAHRRLEAGGLQGQTPLLPGPPVMTRRPVEFRFEDRR